MRVWLCFRENKFEAVAFGDWPEIFPDVNPADEECPICGRHFSNRGCGFQEIQNPYVDFTPSAFKGDSLTGVTIGGVKPMP